ncbi:MAG: nucleotidyl transferase AbiEii/AbiGii toxin family protein [Candidatus Altiarchaeales archaeon]|nr:nucleotidyl transferase AbiEii/AbiGii toxin family protein [Candidatus Altiarchaeales archaeon]
MFEEFLNREKGIFDILNKLLKENLTFVVIGGYGVSAYKHRFSIDADIVISHENVQKFEEVLKKSGFKKTASKELENLYSSKFIRYATEGKANVTIDLLVGGTGVRQTNAAFSFEMLRENSDYRKIIGSSGEVKALVPKKEVLIAMKLHAGRMTDLRDVAALARDVDIGQIKSLLQIGDKKRIKEHLDKLESLLETADFMNSFKGVFIEKKYDIDTTTIKKICTLADSL